MKVRNQDRINYIVAVCGYEGIEELFGYFSKEEAIEFLRELKEKKTKQSKKIMKYTKPEQICLMSEKDNNEIGCVCKELPDDLKNKETWWM